VFDYRCQKAQNAANTTITFYDWLALLNIQKFQPPQLVLSILMLLENLYNTRGEQLQLQRLKIWK